MILIMRSKRLSLRMYIHYMVKLILWVLQSIRNQSIRADLMSNLDQVIILMKDCLKQVNSRLLEAYLLDAEEALEVLGEGYTSGNESQTVELLIYEIHPLLKQLNEQYQTEFPSDKVTAYFDSLDNELGIVYKQRQDYEQSVAMINQTIASYLDAEDKEMQKVLPHYFEKYKTDGVEYNIYLGQSMLKNEKFSRFHLKDFRLLAVGKYL